MKPKILLSVGPRPDGYAEAVAGVGGEPVVAYRPEYKEEYDGLLLCGGSDIHPGYYGRDIMGSVDIDPERDRCEFELVKAFLDAGKPVMGICRGFQLLNAYFGGTLVQHLPNTEVHRVDINHYGIHQVLSLEGSVFEKLYGRAFFVNTNHHQGIERMGAELLPGAYHDQLVEAFTHARLPVLAVQWHPEKMCFGFRRDDCVDGAPIMEYFVNLCREYQK